MPKFINRVGQRFGRLVVLQHVGKSVHKKQLWMCKCDCGVEQIVSGNELGSGDTTSCGCYLQERITKHGGTGKGSYNTWRGMMRRCYNPQDKDYRRYGAVGVAVHEPWHEYVNFVRDMGEPVGAETLDRKDTYGGYAPENCRWVGTIIQARNRRFSTKNTSGYTGIYSYGDRWMASISANKKKYYSKVFIDLGDALAARKELERIHWNVSR